MSDTQYEDMELVISEEEFIANLLDLTEQNLAEVAVIERTIKDRLCADGEDYALRELLKELQAINEKYT